MSELITHFGLTVRASREARGWSQELLAAKANLNRTYVGEIERGATSPSLITLLKLAEALGVKPSGLLDQCEQRLTN